MADMVVGEVRSLIDISCDRHIGYESSFYPSLWRIRSWQRWLEAWTWFSWHSFSQRDFVYRRTSPFMI